MVASSSEPADRPFARPRPGPGRHRASEAEVAVEAVAERPRPRPAPRLVTTFTVAASPATLDRRRAVLPAFPVAPTVPTAAGTAGPPAAGGRSLRHLIRSGRDLGSLAGAGALSQLLTVVSGPLVARMVGPEGRGEIATVTLVTVLAAFIVQGGYPAAITRAVAAANAPALDVMRGRMLRGALWCLVPAAGGAGVAWFLLRGSEYHWTLVGEAFVTTLLTAWSRPILAMLQGEGDVLKNSALLLVSAGGYVLLVLLAFIFFPHTPSPVIVAFFMASLAYSLVISLRYLKKPTGDPRATDATKDMDSFARKGFFSGIMLLDGLGFDAFLVGVVLGQVALGQFAVAASAANVPAVVLTPVGGMLLARMAAQQTSQAAQRVMRQWVTGAFALAAGVVVVLEIAVGPLIRLAFGAAYEPAIPLARLLVFAWGLLAFRKVLNSVALAQGRATRTSVIELVAALSMLGCVIAFLHLYGLDGAGYGMLVGASIAFVALVFTVRWAADADYRTAHEFTVGEVAELAAVDRSLT